MAENTIIHEISLAGYKATSTGGMLDLGTWGSYGIEKLHLTLDAAWQDLTITAFFNVKGEVVGKALVGKDGYADVPWEATKENTFAGRIVFEGSMNNQRRISANLNFKVTNHSEFEDSDPVPTDDRWNQFVTQNKEYRDGAYEAAERANSRAEDAEVASEGAQAAARAAKASENAAAASASNAAADAAKAGQYAKAAQAAQEAAENAAAAAAASKSAADTLAAEAARAALAAEESKATANAAANLAGENATAAQQAAENAAAAANYAGQSASDAAASKAAAEIAAQAAQEAQAAAAAARDDAVKAQTAAQTAAKSAQDAQAAAEKARDDAKAAQKGAEDARDAAAGSAEAAAKSEENAKQSADTLAESVENVAANTAAVAELKENKAEIDDTAVGANAWSSKHIVDMLCPPLEESGNPVVCYPVAGYPLGVKASWEPMQEGTGTPYPAGGGKNLWGDLIQNTFVSQQGFLSGYSGAKTTGKIPCSEGDDYTLSCATSFAPVPGNIGVLAYFDASDTMLTRVANTYQRAFTLKAPANAAYLRASCYKETDADNVQLEKSATATAYAPYENIRPIKGRDSVTVERCGENLSTTAGFDSIGWATKYEDLLNVLNKLLPGTYVLDLTFTLKNFFSTYTSDTAESNAFRLNVRFDDGTPCIVTDGEQITKAENLPSTRKITKTFVITPQNKGRVATAYMYACGRDEATDGAPNGALGVGSISNVTITLGATAPTNYTPYTGQTNTLTLPETVYGGEVDAVTGDGQETWKIIDLANAKISLFDINQHGIANFSLDTKLNNIYTTPGQADYFTSSLPQDTSVFNDATKIGIMKANASTIYIRLKETDANNVVTAKAYLASINAKLAYKLAEPVPFTATGAQLIPALAGVNTVLTDADSTTVTGRADPIKRITDLEDAVASQT